MAPKVYPIVTYDQPGSDPNHPGNSRFTFGDKQITSGPANDPEAPPGSTFVSGGQIGGPHLSGIVTPDSSTSEK